MALNIRDPETHQLARELAEATGETMTEAVRNALRERRDRLCQEKEQEVRRLKERIHASAERIRAAFLPDATPIDETELYDENGLPA